MYLHKIIISIPKRETNQTIYTEAPLRLLLRKIAFTVVKMFMKTARLALRNGQMYPQKHMENNLKELRNKIKRILCY